MKNNLQKQLGKRIQYLRKIKGFSQEVFAEKIGIATNTLSSIETGNAFMTAQTLEKILETLNLLPQDLFTFNESNDTNEMYNNILKKIEFIRTDKERLNILYQLINVLF